MKYLFLIIVVIQSSCRNNNTSDPGAGNIILTNNKLPECEWCGADEAPDNITWKTNFAPPNHNGKLITINGVVYKNDKTTPASDVIVYVYNTDNTGIYPKKGNETGNALRHGYLRGWMKTGSDGKYEFTTIKPAPYPGGGNPAHIHVTIKEENKDEYWIDEYFFSDDDVLLDELIKKNELLPAPDPFNNIVSPTIHKNGKYYATRNLTLK